MGLLFALLLTLTSDQTPAPRLSGGFVQLNKEAMGLGRDQWLNVCKAMDAIGFDTIVVQSVEYVGDDGMLYSFYEKSGIDPIAEMMRFPWSKEMKVYVGLRLVQKWDEIRKDERAVTNLLAANRCVAEKIWSRYGKSKEFGGFYIPQELANYGYGEAEIALLRKYFVSLGSHCRTISGGRPISISPYFNPKLADPTRFAQDIKKILDGSGIGEIMLQDGVGVRDLTAADLETKVVPFYRAMAAALRSGQRLWGNVECLEHCMGRDFPVTDLARFAAQRRAVGQIVGKLVTFEFFHYMNPYGYTKSDAAYIAAEQALYEAYRKEVAAK